MYDAIFETYSEIKKNPEIIMIPNLQTWLFAMRKNLHLKEIISTKPHCHNE